MELPVEPGRLRMPLHGSGTAFAALHLAAALPSGNRVILTDLPEVLPLLRKNVEAFASDHSVCEVDIQPLTWGNVEHINSIKKRFTISMIIGSDLIYFNELFAPLLRTLLNLADNISIPVVLAYRSRSLAKEELFWRSFGAWFEISPVNMEGLTDKDLYLFVAYRKAETLDKPVPSDDQILMTTFASDAFETVLLAKIEIADVQ